MSHQKNIIYPAISDTHYRAGPPATYNIGVNTWTKMNIGTATGSGFTLSSNTLTCVLPGWYLVRMGLYQAENTSCEMALYKNGAVYEYGTVDPGGYSTEYCGIVRVAVGDTLELYGYAGSGDLDSYDSISSLFIGRLQ